MTKGRGWSVAARTALSFFTRFMVMGGVEISAGKGALRKSDEVTNDKLIMM
jgi:hypothetical protein